jgi:formylglycine-generating enzyme required for sulfatase activity
MLQSCSLDLFAPPKITTVSISATADPNGVVSVFPGNEKVGVGSEVVITAVPNPGFVFIGFFGGLRSTDNPLRIIASQNLSLTAQFAKTPSLSQMAAIKSVGQTFTMGSKSALSNDNEHPSHLVHFTYSYFIDKCEVTQGQYRTLVGTNPSISNASQGTFGVGDSFPVYYVSWYDAARFCNARSKKDGYDTVYSYDAVCTTPGACPYILENLVIHYDRMGYRLPTEAEWEYACRGGTTSDYFWGDGTTDSAGPYAWDVLNSGNTTHPVGRTRPNAFGLFDMAGNVSELVDDWLAPYNDLLRVNPAGPANLTLQQFESSYQRPVRGGSFALGVTFLRSSSRSEPYPAPALITSPHIGFRTALGAFFPDSTAAVQTQATDTLGITVTCTKSDLESFVGTSSLKIAFVKQNSLQSGGAVCYIDFTSSTPSVRAISDSIQAFGPTVSPNGAYVAYGSRNIGFIAPSQTTVRLLNNSSTACSRTTTTNSAYLPSWWVDTATGDTCLVCADGAAMNNDTQVWNNEHTNLWRLSAGKFSGAPQMITAKGSYCGGMSKNGRYLATGYPFAYLYDYTLDYRVRYFLPPYSGRDDSGQVCNVSISPSLLAPDQLMFLDFGYSKVSTVVGKPYGFHSIIFVCNSCASCQNHIQKWFEKPAGYAEWDYVKWSNHPDFAAAIAMNQSSGSTGALYLISLKDSSYLKVAQGDGLCYPYLWIDPTKLSEIPDPYADFALYNVPMEANYGSQEAINEKLKLFWKRSASLQVAVVGSSPAFYGVDPSAIHSYTTVNMSTLMGELLLSEVFAQDYFLPHSPLRAVILDLDPGFLNNNYYWSDPFLNGLHDSQGFLFDQRNNFWKAGFPAAITSKVAAFGPASWPEFDSTGYPFSRPTGGWGDTLIDKGDYSFADTFVTTNLRTIAATADTLASHGITLIIVHYPENPLYKYTSSIGRYGPSRATFSQEAQWVDSLCAANPFVHFYDANDGGNHDYTDAEALDPNHLDYLGAQKLSKRLDSLLVLYVK